MYKRQSYINASKQFDFELAIATPENFIPSLYENDIENISMTNMRSTKLHIGISFLLKYLDSLVWEYFQ